MKRNISILLFIVMTVFVQAGSLVVNGNAAYVIAHPSQPHATEKRAAQELALYLEKITGKPFEIVSEGHEPAEKHIIFVGQTDYAKCHGVDYASFAPEEWLIWTQPDGNVILGGGKYVGIYYSVCDYLERQFGIRWLAEDCEIVPENPKAETGNWHLRRKPAFAVRQIFDLLDWSPTTGRFKEHNKGFSYTQEETGVSKYFGGNRPYHTAGDYCQDWPDTPELYSRDSNGNPLKPVLGGDVGGQLCMSNPEVRERVLQRMKEYIERDRRESVEKEVAPPLIYDFSGNDNPNKCTCPGCMALAEKEGTYSGATLDFINWIAREIKKDYPDIIVKTFAYMYCDEPPKHLRTEPNVMIHIALGGVEFGGFNSIYDTMRSLQHPINKKTLERFQN